MGIPQKNAPAGAQLNGIDVTTFSKIPPMLVEAPAQAIVSFETRTRWAGGMRCRSEVSSIEMGGQRMARKFTMETDEPAEICGTNTAPSPQELILSAVGSCVATCYSIHATAMGMELRSVEVEMRGTLDLRGNLELADVPKGFPEVTCTVHVDANATPDQVQALHEKVLRNSPNYYNITKPIPARPQLVIAG